MVKLLGIGLLVLSAASAHAGIDSRSRGTQDNPAVNVNGLFADQLKAIELDFADGETYSEISAEDKATVMAALKRIARKLESSGDVDNLTASEKAAVFNDQELANNILTKAGDDSLLVCKRRKKWVEPSTTNALP